MDALARLLELDQRYRLILHSTDYIHDEILEQAQPDAKQKYFEAEREIDGEMERSEASQG